MLVINSFDALTRVSFPSFKEKRDKVGFILQWSRSLYSVDDDTGGSAFQMHKIQSMNLFHFKGMNFYHKLRVHGSPSDIYSFKCSGKGVISLFLVASNFSVFCFVFRK
jgi:hypothetical protein